MANTVDQVMHKETKRFCRRIAGDPGVDKAMRDMAEAEQEWAQRLRAEFRETAERTREAQEVEKKLSDFEVQKLAAFEKCASCTTCEWSR